MFLLLLCISLYCISLLRKISNFRLYAKTVIGLRPKAWSSPPAGYNFATLYNKLEIVRHKKAVDIHYSFFSFIIGLLSVIVI